MRVQEGEQGRRRVRGDSKRDLQEGGEEYVKHNKHELNDFVVQQNEI